MRILYLFMDLKLDSLLIQKIFYYLNYTLIELLSIINKKGSVF